MGFSRSNYSTSIVPHLSFSAKVSSMNQCSEEDDDIKIKSLFYKMVWDLGLACFIPKISRRRLSDEENEEEEKGGGNNNLEHNKAWLLAESGGELNSGEPHSVHSSFRFSICSQVELESIKASTSSSATVLMVNLHNGKLDSKSGDLSLKRIETLEKSISPVAPSLIRYTYAQIASATRNFTKGRVLGRGAWSCVFRGKVGGKKRATVAIKRLSSEDKESYKAFCRELMIASSLHHQHIVPLVGFCIDPEEGLFLVYKFVSGGSLEKYLHGKRRGVKGGSVLPWSVRYKVAVGIAEAIGYLHNGTERCVVHRDIKPSNILLSSRKSAKLCDFGLAAWTPAPSIPFLCKTVKGTFGYLAPEYFQHGKVSDKTDVYAFGVVLLELLTGRKPIETNRGPGEENLVVWAKPLLQQGYTEKLLDPRIKLTGKHSDRVGQMVQAATACTHNEESRRPDIEEVIALLKGENPECISRKRSGLAGNNGCLSDRFTNWQLTKSDMKGHLALAMLGVAESDEDDQLYCL